MSTGIRITNSPGALVRNCTVVGHGIAVDLVDSQTVSINGLNASYNYRSSDHMKMYGSKVGRNDLCPCGSGLKIKKCKGSFSMSTGIRSNNSTFTVGKATIVADTGVDLQNNSKAHIDELNFYSSDTPASLIQVLRALPVQPPHELVIDAMEQQRIKGNIDDSKLWGWFQNQGINVAFWAQISLAIASLS